jgi:predicted nucleic acid-binding protein
VISTTASFVLIDSSVYIDNLRERRFEKELLDLRWVVRLSAVVLAELRRGARSREMIKFVDAIAKNFHVIAPNEREWDESGKIVARLVKAQDYDIHKTREIHFDVLIALTARKIGAVLITRDAADFTAIRQFVEFKLLCW